MIISGIVVMAISIFSFCSGLRNGYLMEILSGCCLIFGIGLSLFISGLMKKYISYK